MSFILKNNLVALNIELTNKGRELLAEGNLVMSKWAVGDSEINYKFAREESYNPFFYNILKPKDNVSDIKYFIPKTPESRSLKNNLRGITASRIEITNTTNDRGFFFKENNSIEFKYHNNTQYIKQNDIIIEMSGVTGGTRLEIKQSSNYGLNTNPIEKNDYLLINWINPLINDTITGNTIFLDKPSPYLWYKVESIISGSLENDNLVIEVDRNLPNFLGQNGNDIRLVSYENPDFTLSTPVGSDIELFENNTNVGIVDIPVWNLSIAFSENIAGILKSHKQIDKYNSRQYVNFINYVESKAKHVGIIHYTNNSPSNIYGEQLCSNLSLEIPTIMWHNNVKGEIGIKIRSGSTIKKNESFDLIYRDLVDENDYVVGKVFPCLKIFLIEDQELIFAMSYKSNRNWTLPSFDAELGDNFCQNPEIEPPVIECPEISAEFIRKPADPITGGGEITIVVNGGVIPYTYYLDGISQGNNNQITGLLAGTYDIVIEDNNSCSSTTYQVTVLETEIPETNITTNIRSVYFPINSTGYLSTDSGEIYKTVNSGQSWTEVYNNPSYEIRSLHFINENVGFGAVSNAGVLLKTTDGGNNWTVISSINFSGIDLYDVQMVGVNTLYVAGQFSSFWKSTNQGNTFNGKTLLGNIEIPTIKFVDANNGFVGGIGGGFGENTFNKTTDGGDTFTSTDTLQTRSVDFWDINLGIRTTSAGVVLRSTNGGTVWQENVISGDINDAVLNDVNFASSNVVYMATGNDLTEPKIVWKSIDGGENWVKLPTNTTATLTSIYAITEDVVIVVGFNGVILRSTNGGSTWTKISGTI
ncbi:MAG: WD40/YVTN/BNR-like repeat-containing protein [bacterium]